MMRVLLLLFVLTITPTLQIFAADADCSGCKQLAKIRVTDSGLSKIIQQSVDSNIDEINAQIIERGQLKDQVIKPSADCKYKPLGSNQSGAAEDFSKCPFITDYDHEEGGIALSGPKHPAEAGFTQGKINNIKLEMVKPVKCENLKCHIVIKMTKLNVDGRFYVKQLDNKTDVIPRKLVTLSMPDNAEPITYEFDAAINRNTGRLENIARTVDGSTKIHIPEGSLNLDVEEKTFKNAEAQRTAELNEVYQRLRSSLPNFQKKEVLEDQVRVARANLFFEKISAAEKSSGKKIEAFSPEWNKLSSESDRAYSVADLAKAVQTTLPDTKDPVAQTENLRKLSPDILKLPSVNRIFDQSEFHALAKLNGYPNTGAYLLSKSASSTINLAMNESAVLDVFTDTFADRFDDINQEINSSLADMPYYIDQLAKLPKINSQLLVDINLAEEKLAELEKKVNDKSYSEKERAKYKEQFLQALKEYKDIEAKLDSDDNWMKLKTQMVVDKVSNSNKVVGMSVYPLANCTPPPLSPDNDKGDYDVGTEVTVDGLNEYFRKLQDGGDLNFCTEQIKNGKCNGQKINFTSAPYAKFDPATGKNKVYIKNSIGSFGKVETEFNTRFFKCGNSPCLELTDINSSSKSLILKIVGAGYMTEKAIAESAKSLSQEGPMTVQIADLKNISTNPKTGAVNLEWTLH